MTSQAVEEITEEHITDDLSIGWWTELQTDGVVTLNKVDKVRFKQWLLWMEEYGLQYGFNVDLDVLRMKQTEQGYEFWLA